MDLQSQAQDLLDLSSHVTLLLQKQSDSLIRKRTIVKNNSNEADVDENLAYDITLASKSLHVLEIRREIRSAMNEISEIKEQLNNNQDNLTSTWYDYIQDTMEHLHVLLKRGIELASFEIPNPEEYRKTVYYDNYDNFEYETEESLSPNDLVYCDDRIYQDDSSLSDTSTRSRPASIMSPPSPTPDTVQEHRSKSNLRRYTMDNEGVSAARLFIGNLGLQQAPSKASTTTFISPEQTEADTSINTNTGHSSLKLDHDTHSSLAAHQLSQLIINESDEISDEFVDAVERQDENHSNNDHNEPFLIKELTSQSKRSNSSRSLPTFLESVPEEPIIRWGDNEYSRNVPSLALSSLSSQSTSAYHISLLRHKAANLFAQKVNVSNPIRIGAGYGSYIAYTCTVKSQEGASIIVRKRYSDFVKLREQLIKAYPKFRKLIPSLPPKRVMGKFMPEFIEKRRKGLEYFLAYVLLHPILGPTAVVRRWFADNS
ncbi:38430_t:CDS:2 [Gigaspora margarita]|uniref:Endosomal/vacuolar adapter protein YPT35 n=1 Tax=Gigaspora margarita TaxID=4874 RepID=A0ABN7VUH0_GIGMA|nr:38430_t:CDS:2 [Gigaspora margarita]